MELGCHHFQTKPIVQQRGFLHFSVIKRGWEIQKQIIIAGKIIKLNARFSIATFDAKYKIIKVYKNTFGFKQNILGT